MTIQNYTKQALKTASKFFLAVAIMIYIVSVPLLHYKFDCPWRVAFESSWILSLFSVVTFVATFFSRNVSPVERQKGIEESSTNQDFICPSPEELELTRMKENKRKDELCGGKHDGAEFSFAY